MSNSHKKYRLSLAPKKEVFPVLSLSLTVPFIICYYFENDFYGWKSSKLF